MSKAALLLIYITFGHDPNRSFKSRKVKNCTKCSYRGYTNGHVRMISIFLLRELIRHILFAFYQWLLNGFFHGWQMLADKHKDIPAQMERMVRVGHLRDMYRGMAAYLQEEKRGEIKHLMKQFRFRKVIFTFIYLVEIVYLSFFDVLF